MPPSKIISAAWTLLLTLLCVLFVLAPVRAVATPAQQEINAVSERAKAARARMEDLAAELEERTEEYGDVQARLEETREQIRKNEARLEQARSRVDDAQARFEERMVSMYRTGNAGIVGFLLGVTDFRDLVVRLDMMRLIAENDARVVTELRQARAEFASIAYALDNRRSEQIALRREGEKRKTAVERALKAQQQHVKSLDDEVQRLIAQERERREREARARAEAAAAEARRRAEAAAAAAAAQAGRPPVHAPGGAGNMTVVGIAYQFVGVTPYVWGGETPAGFDCSGLVMYCYRQLGINLPRTSRQQFLVGTRVPPDRLDLLQPGDLVFFGRDGDPTRVHHVGIYIGDGDMIHAPQTGEKVSVNSLTDRIARRGDYVGAVRP